MARSFIGSGMSFPLKLDPNGAVAVSHDEDNIEQCIKIILGTAKGERLYRPAFGCAIHDLVFSPNTHVTAMKVENAGTLLNVSPARSSGESSIWLVVAKSS